MNVGTLKDLFDAFVRRVPAVRVLGAKSARITAYRLGLKLLAKGKTHVECQFVDVNVLFLHVFN
jgi:hypothetical protein